MASSKNTNILLPVSGRVIRLDTVDSTNNYAMQRINAASAAHGDVILANRQFAGKGQRGKTWQDTPGQSILMSIIVAPTVELSAQPLFLAAVAVAVVEVLQQYITSLPVSIKWPNDILVGDKKAAGILIENVVKGNFWQWAVVGIGINVQQNSFEEEGLRHATSLRMSGGGATTLAELAAEVSKAVLSASSTVREHEPNEVLKAYNSRLYKAGNLQAFRKDDGIVHMRVLGMNEAGSLLLHSSTGIDAYIHGSVEWFWE